MTSSEPPLHYAWLVFGSVSVRQPGMGDRSGSHKDLLCLLFMSSAWLWWTLFGAELMTLRALRPSWHAATTQCFPAVWSRQQDVHVPRANVAGLDGEILYILSILRSPGSHGRRAV